MWYRNSEPKSDRERWLEQDLESARQQLEDSRRQEEEARKVRMQEYRERAEEERRTADTWPEALRKQEYLFRQEVGYQRKFEREHDDYFEPGADACAKALEYWKEEAEKVQSETEALEQKIIELRSGIAHKVADRLDEHKDMPDGWYATAGSLREYTEDNLDDWLYW